MFMLMAFYIYVCFYVLPMKCLCVCVCTCVCVCVCVCVYVCMCEQMRLLARLSLCTYIVCSFDFYLTYARLRENKS